MEEVPRIVRSDDNENVLDTCLQECLYGVVDHGFVIHGQELLGCDLREGPETCGASTSEYDAFHRVAILYQNLETPVKDTESAESRGCRDCLSCAYGLRICVLPTGEIDRDGEGRTFSSLPLSTIIVSGIRYQ